MLQRTVSASTLLRLLGVGFLGYGLVVVALVLTAQIDASGSVIYSGPVIFFAPLRWQVAQYLLFGGIFPGAPLVPVPIGTLVPLGMLTPGPLFWFGFGLLCVGLTSRRVPLAYGGLQLALWMLSASVWNPILWLHDMFHYGVAVGDVGPLFLVTLALSLLLAALYQPVTHGLTRLVSPSSVV